MTIKTANTSELTGSEREGIHSLFELVFGRERPVEVLFGEYTNSVKGYSYHALCEDAGKVVGHAVYVPFRYLDRERPFLLALGIDAMVHPEYRGRGLYRLLTEACCEKAKSDGCAMRIGFPNENSYPIQVKNFGFSDIGQLDTYVLPVSLKGISGKLSCIDFLGRALCWLVLRLSRLSSNSDREYKYRYRRERETFDAVRYKWFGGEYGTVEEDGLRAVYRNAEFHGVDATFLMDITPLSRANFDRAVRRIHERESGTPMIIYVGNLPFRPLSMFRIPRRFEPKHFHFVGKIFDEEALDGSALDIGNWELNLSGYDLL